MSNNKRKRTNDIGILDSDVVLDYLNKYPLIYKGIQAAALLEKIPLPINDNIAKDFNLNPLEGFKWISNHIENNIRTHFGDYFPIEHMIIKDNDMYNYDYLFFIQYSEELQSDIFMAIFSLYKIQLYEWLSTFIEIMSIKYNITIEFEINFSHRMAFEGDIGFNGLELKMKIYKPEKEFNNNYLMNQYRDRSRSPSRSKY
jgi:hypothetical protein